MTPIEVLRRVATRRHGGLYLFLLGFVAIAFALRLALAGREFAAVDYDLSLAGAFAWGALFDAATALLIAAPACVLLTLAPAGLFNNRVARLLAHAVFAVTLYLLFFSVVAEWTFWGEFHSRFNFIAVDYLVYTTEVLNNIRESYPMGLIVAGVGVAAAGAYAVLVRTGLIRAWLTAPAENWRRRWVAGLAWVGLAVVGAWLLDEQGMLKARNAFHRELAKNGLWSFVAAFRNNELDYDTFYAKVTPDQAFSTLAGELAADHGVSLATDRHDTLRFIANPGPELHPNVIQITVESLSADFLGLFNPQSKLTPNLDALARESLVFSNFYATGTRTDRGMEALTLSLPPTPGRSLIKRPRNENLFTLGSILRSRGYDTAFLYGGYGYFDNMNAYFGGNGYRVIDRASVAASDVTFANAWGACDEDLLRWTLREADASHAKGTPFHFFVMTTSNHRPFTYPAGRIDLPPKVSGRDGAVKYTDFAIGEFLRAARSKPWFAHTVFVVVADHCASVAGKSELPVDNYHIPLLIYAPGGQIAPGRVDDLTSQVDYAPTLLGLLHWSYATRFFGWDVVHAGGDRRALLGNYQKLGLYEPGVLAVLAPRQTYQAYPCCPDAASRADSALPDVRIETIAYYQAASYLYRSGRYKALSPDEQARASKLAGMPQLSSVP